MRFVCNSISSFWTGTRLWTAISYESNRSESQLAAAGMSGLADTKLARDQRRGVQAAADNAGNAAGA